MIERPRLETVPKQAHNLLVLESSEKSRLRERVEACNGLVRMFVHPMYEKWRGNEYEYKDDPSHKKLVEIEEVLSRLVAMPEEKTPPIIIFEEQRFLQNLQDWLKANPNGQTQDGIYVIETRSNHPSPAKEEVDDKVAWGELIDILKDVGVKKILMAGTQLGINTTIQGKDWTGKAPFLERCVGIAMSHLSNDKAGEFEVELSALIDPPQARMEFNSFKKSI